MPKIVDLAGKVFGRWAVIKQDMSGNHSKGQRYWICRCECGTERSVRAGLLVRGESLSCGCLARELSSKTHRKHGHWQNGKGSPTYESWCAMKQRCLNPNNQAWDKYGGANIIVCQRWQDFENFLFDLGERPEGHTLDRFPEIDRGYTCGNCAQCIENGWEKNARWATPAEQARNMKSNHWLTLNGRTMVIQDWSNETGLKDVTIHKRLKRGWSVEKTLTTPVDRNKCPKKYRD